MKSDEVFLRHILDEIYFLMKETDGVEFEDFMKEGLLQRACTRSLEIIGEAVKNLTTDFKKRHKDVEWKKIAGLRDKIIHFYFGINWDIVWDVIKKRLPGFKLKIEKILLDLR